MLIAVYYAMQTIRIVSKGPYSALLLKQRKSIGLLVHVLPMQGLACNGTQPHHSSAVLIVLGNDGHPELYDVHRIVYMHVRGCSVNSLVKRGT